MTAAGVGQVIEHAKTPWNDALVVARGEERTLEVAGALYAAYHPRRWFHGFYWDMLAAVALGHARSNPRVLMIGLGGGTALRAIRKLLPGADLTAVEIDPVMVSVAQRHFGFNDVKARVIVGDGYTHVDEVAGGEPAGRYDVILDDAFIAGDETLRVEAATQGLVLRLARGLKPGGTLAVNMFADGVTDETRRAFDRGFQLVPALGGNVILGHALHVDAVMAAAERVQNIANAELA